MDKFFQKKNSTAHPAVGTGNTVFVKLKDNTSVLHPVFELVSNYAPSCKYAYVPDFREGFTFVETLNMTLAAPGISDLLAILLQPL